MLIELWVLFVLTNMWVGIHIFTEEYPNEEFTRNRTLEFFVFCLFCLVTPIQIIWACSKVPSILTFLFKERTIKWRKP